MASKKFIAVDSDVLRALVELKECLELNPNYDIYHSQLELIKNYGKIVKKMLNLVLTGELNLFVGNTVYHEVKHRHNCVEFIKEFCYMPKMNDDNYKDIIAKTDELALKYCKNYKVGNKLYYPPMDLRYVPYFKQYVPCNDAYVMAEATIVNCFLITCNAKDFIYNEHYKERNELRKTGIIAINRNMRYMDKNGSSPMPVSIERFGLWLLYSKGVKNINLPLANEDSIDNADNNI